MDFWIKAAQLLLSLSILVVLHEFGHYLTARYFKIRVEKFYLFFNPWFSLFKKKIGETEWGIGWLPLGGYVKIAGMIDESMDKEQMAQPAQPWEFRSKPAWQRLIVMIGGVVVNILVGILIYILVLFAWGEEQVHTEDLTAGLAIHPYLEKYDLHSGDNILKIDGEKVTHLNDINNGLLLRNKHTLTVKKPDGSIKEIVLPDGIDYEIFHEGAFPVTELRHASTEVHYVAAVKSVDELGINAGDVLREINGTPVKKINLSDPELMNAKSYEVVVLRGKNRVTLPFSKKEFEQMLKAFPAFAAGLKYQDRILRINDQPIEYFDQIQAALYNARQKSATLEVLRGNDTITLRTRVSYKSTIGFSPIPVIYADSAAIQTVNYSFGASIGRGVSRGFQTLSDYVSQLKFLFTRKGATSIGGFGAIGSMFPSVWDWERFWMNTALISIILAFMNILPIPALDGGHVVFLLYEMITGREASQKVLEYAQYIGFFLLVGLVIYANANDIIRWLNP